MVKIVYLQSLKSYVLRAGDRFFTFNIDMNKFNDYLPKIGDKKYLSCVGMAEYRGRSLTIVPIIKLLIEKKDGSLISDRELYRLNMSEGSVNDMIRNGLISRSEISKSSVHYSDLWKFYDEIIVTAGIGDNLSVIGVGDNGNKISEGFINFGGCRTPQIFKYSDKVVVIDRHGKDLKILVDGLVVDSTRMTVSSIYNNKYLNFK